MRHMAAAAGPGRAASGGGSSSGSEGGGDDAAIPHNAANPMEIRTDGAGTLLQVRAGVPSQRQRPWLHAAPGIHQSWCHKTRQPCQHSLRL